MSNQVGFNKNDLILFKKCYENAIKNNVKEFEYNGNEYLVSYAKYLIQFLESKLNNT